MKLLQRALSPIVEVREEESTTLLLMFLNSFLIMTAHNIVKWLSRAQFIEDLGADNLPYVLLAAGILIGLVMQGYSRAIGYMPARWIIPAAQLLMAGLLIGFWILFEIGQDWTSVGLYFFSLIHGLLLISQFWTLANDVYDPRQAKRLFGFIGGGASLGGVMGSAILAFSVERVGSGNMLIVSAALLVLSALVVTTVIRRSGPVLQQSATPSGRHEESVGKRGLRLLFESRHLQLIAVVIGFAALGAGLLEQQLNMATEEAKGAGGAAGIAAFLGQIGLYTSIVGFVIQVWLTSRIQTRLGIGFAMLILPVSLGATGGLILATGGLWAAAMARILDTSLRYTVDKTSREILFIPLPAHLKHQAKPFVDGTVDRVSKALVALLILVLIKPWGLGLGWRQLSVVSLVITGLWIIAAVKARREYLITFRKAVDRQEMKPTEVRVATADLSTVETLVEELAHPEEERVLYAIDVLKSLDKRNLVTPLLLHHESAAVRAHALHAMSSARSEIAARWVPAIQRMIGDESPEVRAAAVGALANIRNEDAAEYANTLLEDEDPRIVATAAVVLAGSGREDHMASAQSALAELATDARESSNLLRRDLAAAIGQVGDERSRNLLIPLLHDSDPEVAEEAIRSVRELGASDFIFVPTLISLLGDRVLKSDARDTLVSYGEQVIDLLGYFLRDDGENKWVRRHIPATLSRIPCQRSMDVLIDALSEKDGFLRFKVLTALERLRREDPRLRFSRAPIENLALQECQRYLNHLRLHHSLFVRTALPKDSVLSRAIQEKLGRRVDRIYRILGLLFGWKNISGARWAIERGDARQRAEAVEYLDNLLAGDLRIRLMLILEDLPPAEKIRKSDALMKQQPLDMGESIIQLIHDEDQVLAAAAIDLIRECELWQFKEDVEKVLAHRAPKDWFVFEAASWTLACQRLTPELRRARWLEPLPAVALVDRLRRLAMFTSVGIDELFRIAGAGHQVRHESGATLLREGAVPDSMHVLLDGQVVAQSQDGETREIGPPSALGFEELLDGCLMAETVRAAKPSVSLTLSNEEFRTLLASNTDLMQGLFRVLAVRVSEKGERRVIRGEAGAELSNLAGGDLTPIQKVLALQKIPVFSQVSADEMFRLAAVARQVTLDEGNVLAGESDPPALCVVLAGRLSLELPDNPGNKLYAGPGDSVGTFETLAGNRSNSIRLVVIQPGVALRLERDELFDLLGQRPALMQQIFSALFGGSR